MLLHSSKLKVSTLVFPAKRKFLYCTLFSSAVILTVKHRQRDRVCALCCTLVSFYADYFITSAVCSAGRRRGFLWQVQGDRREHRSVSSKWVPLMEVTPMQEEETSAFSENTAGKRSGKKKEKNNDCRWFSWRPTGKQVFAIRSSLQFFYRRN